MEHSGISASEEIVVKDRPFRKTYAEKRSFGHLEQKMTRNRFDKWWQRLCLALVYMGGFQSVQLFNKLITQYGARTYFYVSLMAVTVGFPVYYLEYSLGQFASADSSVIFSRISPVMSGFGVSSVLVNLAQLIFEQKQLANSLTLAGLALFTVLGSSGYNLDGCFFGYNTQESCVDVSMDCNSLRQVIGSEEDILESFDVDDESYMEYNSQCLMSRLQNGPGTRGRTSNERPSTGTNQFLTRYLRVVDDDAPSFGLFSSMLLVSLVTVVSCYMSIRTTVWLSVVCVLLYVVGMMAVVLIHTVYKASMYHVVAGRNREDSPWTEVAYESLLYVIHTMHIGKGGVVVLGSFNRFHNNTIRDCLVVLFMYMFVPMCGAIIFDQALRHYHYDINNHNGDFVRTAEAESVTTSIFLASFSVYEEYTPSVVCIVCLCLAMYFVARQTFIIYVIVFAVREWFSICEKGTLTLLTQTLALCLALFATIYMCKVAGIAYDFCARIVNNVPPTLILLELLIVVYIYGPRQLFVDLNFMLFGDAREKEARSNPWKSFASVLNICLICLWSLVIPVVLLLCLHGRKPNKEGSRYGSHFEVIVILMPVLVYFIYKIIRAKLIDGVSIWMYFQPDLLWGPREDKHRKQNEHEHMKTRLKK